MPSLLAKLCDLLRIQGQRRRKHFEYDRPLCLCIVAEPHLTRLSTPQMLLQLIFAETLHSWIHGTFSCYPDCSIRYAFLSKVSSSRMISMPFQDRLLAFYLQADRNFLPYVPTCQIERKEAVKVCFLSIAKKGTPVHFEATVRRRCCWCCLRLSLHVF